MKDTKDVIRKLNMKLGLEYWSRRGFNWSVSSRPGVNKITKRLTLHTERQKYKNEMLKEVYE
jgi:hypothetical protein